MRTSGWALALLAILLAGDPARAAAQGTSIDLELRAGLVHPTTDLGRTAVVGGAGSVTFGKAEGGPLLGAGVLLGPSPRWGVRLSVDYGFDRSMRGLWQCAPFVACPAVLIEPEGHVSSWTLGGDARFTPDFRIGPLRPVVFAGGGVRGFRLEWSSPLLEVPIPTTFNETNPFARVGAGLSGDAGPVALSGEIDGTLGPFGAKEERFIEGSVADGRNTNFDIGLVLGLRVQVL